MDKEKEKLKKKLTTKEQLECDDIDMSKQKNKLDKKVPDVLECNEIMATKRQCTLNKLAQFASLRNNKRIVAELDTVKKLLK